MRNASTQDHAQTDSRPSLASILRARSHKQRVQRAMAGDMAGPQPATPQVGREDAVDRSSRGSESSVPSMVDDHGSVISVDDDQYYRTSGEQIWDTFWHSGCSEGEDEEAEQPAAVSPSYQYPALITPSLTLDTQQLLGSRKRPTQSQSLGAIEVPAYAEYRPADHAQARTPRRRVVQPCRVSYSIFPPQDAPGITRQRTIRARRCPPHLDLDAPKPRFCSEGSPQHSLRSSASARNLRSGSASSAFSASSAYSASTQMSDASDYTAVTTPAESPRLSWDCPRTPKPKHVSQCMDFHRAASRQPSLPNLQATTYHRPAQPLSATVGDFTAGEARNARVVNAVATAEPYPRPLFAPQVLAPLQPTRRAPLPPVSERLPPPVSTTRSKPAPLSLSRPLPPLPVSRSRPQTPVSAPPRPQRPDHAPQHHFGPALSPPRPAGPPRAASQPLPGQHQGDGDFQPPVVSVFEWDSEGDSDDEEASGSGHAASSSNSFARRIARGFAHIQARKKDVAEHQQHQQQNSARRAETPVAGRPDDLARMRSRSETVTSTVTAAFPPQRPSRQRALTAEDVRRVEEDMDRQLRLVREQVARERCSNEVVVPKEPTRQKSALFGRMLGWRTQ